MSVRLLVGDCREVLAGLDADSIDACVTDPPYGLEFMGKEWDSFKTGRAAKYVSGGTINKERSVTRSGGKKLPIGPNYVSRPAKRCAKCGKQAWSGSPCRCDEPEWVMDNSPLHTLQAWHETWAREVYRVLKPGAHILAFGGTRTHHRLMVAIEDAGFEIRDCLMWLYGSGFPKSLDVSKALDKAAGAERTEVIGSRTRNVKPFDDENGWNQNNTTGSHDYTAPATDLARQWDGWGTALKPAYEPIILARKPLRGSVAANVTAYGTGGLNIDGCRIGTDEETGRKNNIGPYENKRTWNPGVSVPQDSTGRGLGRWPANVILGHHPDCVEVGTKRVKTGMAHRTNSGGNTFGGDNPKPPLPDMTYADADGRETVAAWECHPDCPVALLDAQSGERPTGKPTNGSKATTNGIYGTFGTRSTVGGGDSGGASRFFYTAKASRAERNKGLAGLPEQTSGSLSGRHNGTLGSIVTARNVHPTVKPVDLMQWLVRLVTPKGGTVLDPFMGSGSTGIAADREGCHFIGIEQDPEYLEIARRRIVGDAPLFASVEVSSDT